MSSLGEGLLKTSSESIFGFGNVSMIAGCCWWVHVTRWLSLSGLTWSTVSFVLMTTTGDTWYWCSLISSDLICGDLGFIWSGRIALVFSFRGNVRLEMWLGSVPGNEGLSETWPKVICVFVLWKAAGFDCTCCSKRRLSFLTTWICVHVWRMLFNCHACARGWWNFTLMSKCVFSGNVRKMLKCAKMCGEYQIVRKVAENGKLCDSAPTVHKRCQCYTAPLSR